MQWQNQQQNIKKQAQPPYPLKKRENNENRQKLKNLKPQQYC